MSAHFKGAPRPAGAPTPCRRRDQHHPGGGVAQLVRAPDCDSGCRRFEPVTRPGFPFQLWQRLRAGHTGVLASFAAKMSPIGENRGRRCRRAGRTAHGRVGGEFMTSSMRKLGKQGPGGFGRRPRLHGHEPVLWSGGTKLNRSRRCIRSIELGCTFLEPPRSMALSQTRTCWGRALAGKRDGSSLRRNSASTSRTARCEDRQPPRAYPRGGRGHRSSGCGRIISICSTSTA